MWVPAIRSMPLGKTRTDEGPKLVRMQWRIQDFPEEGALTPKGAPTYYLAIFPRKLHENEEILGQGEGHIFLAYPLDPSLACTTDSELLPVLTPGPI